MSKTILILGGGTGGVVAANLLIDTLPAEHRILLVDKKDKHLFLAGLPLVLVGKRQPEQLMRDLKSLERPNLHVLQAQVQGFKPEENKVVTDRGRLSYDSLIIALGAEQYLDIPGAKSITYNPYHPQNALQLQRVIEQFTAGHIVVFVSSLPFAGAVAPYEIVLLLASYFQRQNRSIRISLVTPESRPFSFAQPETSYKLVQILQSKNIQLITDRQVRSLTPDGRLKLDQEEIQGDLFIGIPQQRGPRPFQDSPIVGPEGWIEVDPQSLETACPHVYAVGDAVGLKTTTGKWIPKVGFFAHYGAEVVARNIALEYAGKSPRFQFEGGAAGASMLTDFHKGCFVSLDAYASPPTLSLSRPNWLAFATKTLFEKYWLRCWF